jgi:hypothetical protein
MAVIDGWTVLLMEARVRNFERWPILGREIWRSLPGWADRNTYIEEVDYMKRFLSGHLDWMDQELRPTSDAEAFAEVFGSSVRQSAPRFSASPNPFRTGTTIRVEGPDETFSELAVFNLLGRKVAAVKSDRDSNGKAAFRWDGMDGLGNPAAAGIYILRFVGDGGRYPAVRLVKY